MIIEQSGNLVTALVGVLGAAVGAAASYFTTSQMVVTKYNTALHKKRIDAYVNLWEKFRPLSRYARKRKVDKDDIGNIRDDLVKWYYENGGIFLSRSSQSGWVEIVEELEKMIRHPVNVFRDDKLSWDSFDELYKQCSKFRTDISKDIGSRLEYRGKKERLTTRLKRDNILPSSKKKEEENKNCKNNEDRQYYENLPQLVMV